MTATHLRVCQVKEALTAKNDCTTKQKGTLGNLNQDGKKRMKEVIRAKRSSWSMEVGENRGDKAGRGKYKEAVFNPLKV